MGRCRRQGVAPCAGVAGPRRTQLRPHHRGRQTQRSSLALACPADINTGLDCIDMGQHLTSVVKSLAENKIIEMFILIILGT